MNPRRIVGLVLATVFATGCHTTTAARDTGHGAAGRPDTGQRGTLLAIGGGLDDDNRPVFTRFLELAAANGPPRIVVVTAATGDQEPMAIGKIAALQTWRPGVPCEVVRRETPTDATVAAIDTATALFFTGGDQKRIAERYRPGDAESPEWAAMARLLLRGGVIAGSSAGLAMMGETMFHTGRSAAALGVPQPPDDDGAPVALGPRLGPGMRFLPWALTDSHFFERDRTGRLVAGLEACGQRLGLGVGEDGCVEIDLATGVVTGVAVSDSLLVDAGSMVRDGTSRRGATARLIRQGERISLVETLRTSPRPPMRPGIAPAAEVVVEEGQHRQLAMWRLFARASQGGVWQLDLDGWSLAVWSDGAGGTVFDIELGRPAGR